MPTTGMHDILVGKDIKCGGWRHVGVLFAIIIVTIQCSCLFLVWFGLRTNGWTGYECNTSFHSSRGFPISEFFSRVK